MFSKGNEMGEDLGSYVNLQPENSVRGLLVQLGEETGCLPTRHAWPGVFQSKAKLMPPPARRPHPDPTVTPQSQKRHGKRNKQDRRIKSLRLPSSDFQRY